MVPPSPHAGAGSGSWWSWARVGGLCSANNCHALTVLHTSPEPTGTVRFSGHFSLQPGPVSHLPGQVFSKEVPGGQGPGRVWAPPPEAPLPRPSGPFPVLSPAGVAAPNEPRVGPAHPSRQPLAPAASGMLQPPSFSWQRPWLPPPPACHGAPSAWPHPRGEPKVLLYITPGDVSIFIAVLKPHVFYTEPSSPTPPLPTQQKVFKTLRFLGQANRLGLCWLQQWFQPAATGGETTLKKNH